jgi:hypothetical protein
LIEPVGKLAVVDAAAQRTTDVAERQLGMERFLGISQQETLAEVIERGALLETEIGRRHRAAGYEIDAVEKRFCLIGTGPGAVELGQHAERKSRRARAASGERQRQQQIVVVARNFTSKIIVGECRAKRSIARQIVDRRASREDGRTGDGRSR